MKRLLAILLMGRLLQSLALGQSIQPIYYFTNADGANPNAGLMLGPDGNFYGTTAAGGTNGGYGTIFKVTTNGSLTTLVNFNSTNGANPVAGVMLGPDGNFYGTTSQGGSNNLGTVFKATTNGVLTTLYSFSAENLNGVGDHTNADGASPQAGLALGPDGNLYGTTSQGGRDTLGTVFKVTMNGILTTLITFQWTNGGSPMASLTLMPDDNFYGTTYTGGTFGSGTIFRVTTSGTLTTLVNFNSANGANPSASLTLGPDDNFYGTTTYGGTNSAGTVFKVTTSGTLTTLTNFNFNKGGLAPLAGLTLGPDDNFYGTTYEGGTFGSGTIFKVTTNGFLTTLVNLDNTNGAVPSATVTLGPDGNFYGTTQGGGIGYAGVIYRLNLPQWAPHAATGTAVLVNGFVVAVSVLDYGYGYTNTPLVRIIGGGGNGAQAVAVVNNGIVTAINVLDAGIGYTSAPLVVIEPPFIPNPVLDIAPMSLLAFSNLTVGGSYQLQQSVAWYWTNEPVSFTATNVLYTQMVAGMVSSGDYRLVLNPAPIQAFATPELDYGFVVGATVTSGGSGYATNPAVQIVGSDGVNATAISQISGGTVTNIVITDAGFGYYDAPTIIIAPPPAGATVSPTVLPAMRVDSTSLAPYDNYQIQFTPEIGGTWENWDGGLFSPTDVTNSQFLFITNGTGFFRVQYVP